MREDFVPFMEKPIEAQNMKNPSLGKLRGLCQINQVSKEENQRKNLTSTISQPTFQPCEMANRSACCRTESEQSSRNFASPFSPCEIFASPFLPCKTNECELRKACKIFASLRNHNWRKTISQPNFCLANCEFFTTLWNSPYVIFRYFPADFVRFLFQDILCNYLFSPCNQWGVANISLYMS